MGRSIAFEAAVAGGIPIIANISQCLSANQILSIHGILNGTCNFILTQMEDQGVDYATALAEAQKLGFAEADPTMDVDGTDTAQKLAILAHLAFGVRPRWREIPRRGIDRLDATDLRYAKELGYRIKLLAVAELGEAGLELHVSPTLVHRSTPLAEVRGAYNAINLVGDAVGRCSSGLGRRADADRLGRRGRHDRHGRRPGRDHVPHIAAVVRARGPFPTGRSCPFQRPILFAVQRRRPARRAGRNRRRAGPARDFDRLGHSAHARRHRRHRAAGDHDPRRPGRGHEPAFEAIERMQHVRPPSSRMRVYD